jgi:DnaJ-class molecular chaperone
MVNMRTHDTGDLIIQFDVEFPSEKSLTDVQLKVIETILCVLGILLIEFDFSNLKQFYQNDHMLRFLKVNMLKKYR